MSTELISDADPGLQQKKAELRDGAGAAWADWYPEDRAIAYDDKHFDTFTAGFLAGVQFIARRARS